MKYKFIMVTLVIAVVLGFGFIIFNKESNIGNSILADVQGQEVVVYKSPTCGCCSVYATYLKKKGFKVMIEDVTDMSSVKRGNGIPPELSSCHTSLVGGYVVEGHIPVEAIQKLLSEKPAIKGIAMPGMPVGSPGMPGTKEFPFEIWKLGEEGLFMTI